MVRRTNKRCVGKTRSVGGVVVGDDAERGPIEPESAHPAWGVAEGDLNPHGMLASVVVPAAYVTSVLSPPRGWIFSNIGVHLTVHGSATTASDVDSSMGSMRGERLAACG